MIRVSDNGVRVWYGVLLVLVMTTAPMLHGSGCDNVDVEALKKIILTTSDRRAVLVAAAIGQQQVLFALRVRMQPDDLATPEGAAEVAAARLGDQSAVSQLKRMLKRGDSTAAKMLGYAGTEQTLRIGFDYLLDHENDPSVFKVVSDVPDYGPGARFALFAVMHVEGLPSPNDDFVRWTAWWRRNKPTFKVTPPSSLLPDATLQCYGRIAEWDIGEGVRELYAAGGRNTLPVIEHYAKRGDPRITWSSFGSARGSAQAVLAKAGDESSFKAIVNQLRRGNVIDKLVYIGDSRSVQALINALDLSFFTVPLGGFSEDGKRDMQRRVLQALAALVRNPPLPPDASPTPQNIEIWKAWWQQTKGQVEFNPPSLDCVDCLTDESEKLKHNASEYASRPDQECRAANFQ